LDEYQLTKMIFDHAQLDRRAGEQPAARTPQRRPDPSWERADVLYLYRRRYRRRLDNLRQ
jgi:hypothetical protein